MKQTKIKIVELHGVEFDDWFGVGPIPMAFVLLVREAQQCIKESAKNTGIAGFENVAAAMEQWCLSPSRESDLRRMFSEPFDAVCRDLFAVREPSSVETAAGVIDDILKLLGEDGRAPQNPFEGFKVERVSEFAADEPGVILANPQLPNDAEEVEAHCTGPQRLLVLEETWGNENHDTWNQAWLSHGENNVSVLTGLAEISTFLNALSAQR